jgi:hypothetical protein
LPRLHPPQFHGRTQHSVERVASGERFVLVFWLRSGPLRDVTCPCCLDKGRGKCVLAL